MVNFDRKKMQQRAWIAVKRRNAMDRFKKFKQREADQLVNATIQLERKTPAKYIPGKYFDRYCFTSVESYYAKKDLMPVPAYVKTLPNGNVCMYYNNSVKYIWD